MTSIDEGFIWGCRCHVLPLPITWLKRRASAPQRLSASAPQRLSASAPQRLSADFSTFLSFIIFNSALILAVAGCGERGDQGLHRAGTVSAAETTDGRYSLPLVPSEVNLRLGQVAPGSQKSLAFWLTNRSAATVEVAEIATSCDCLKVELPERTLAPGQKAEGRVELDLRKEPQFLGNVRISVDGTGRKGETVFSMEVYVAVDRD